MRLAAVRKFAAAMLVALPAAAQDLPRLSIDPGAVTVSGLSSGAFMAVQLHVAYSDVFSGAGIVAGGPYYCAAGQVAYAAICMGQVPFFPPNPHLMAAAAKGFALAGTIAPLDALAGHRVYVFSGTADSVVRQNAVDATERFYRAVGVTQQNLRYVKQIPAGHAFITGAPFDGAGGCAANAAPYINRCEVEGKPYDQAGEILAWVYQGAELRPPAAAPAGTPAPFDQAAFDPVPTVSSLADKGHVYVPADCAAADARCRLHVSIHGCGQSASQIGDDWYADLNLNAWADANKIVVLYPQVDPSLLNPQGCWDWWGYTGPAYAVRDGVQMRAITAMVARLMGR